MKDFKLVLILLTLNRYLFIFHWSGLRRITFLKLLVKTSDHRQQRSTSDFDNIKFDDLANGDVNTIANKNFCIKFLECEGNCLYFAKKFPFKKKRSGLNLYCKFLKVFFQFDNCNCRLLENGVYIFRIAVF